MKSIEERTEMAVERTRLAAERTFNSWLRTGLAGVGGGLAIIHLLFFENVYHRLAARLMGQFLILWGGSLFVYAFFGYRRVVREVGHSLKPSKSWMIGLMAFSLTLFAIVFFFFSLKF